ncbi:MAG: lamin tail domain-containing protein [Verrucomicrobiales bacterium]
MKSRTPTGFGLTAAWLLLAVSAAGTTVVNVGAISQVTGPQGLDLDGQIVYAINFSPDDPVRTVNGVNFIPDTQAIPGATLVGPQNVVAWQTKPEFGNSPDANALEEICHDIRWANAGVPETLKATLAVNQGEEYKLQVLISGNHFEDRKWDIRVNSQNAVDEITSLGASPGQSYAQNRITLYSHQFTAPTSSVVVEMGSLFGANEGGDRNAIWQALTLERVFIPPTPDDILLEPTQFFAVQTAAVGRFRAVDRKSGTVQHTFTLVPGAGDADNAKFSLSANQLLPQPFDFSNQPPGTAFFVRVRATDSSDANRFLEEAFNVTIATPHAPTAVSLDAASVSSAAQAGMVAGRLFAADEDAFDVHSFALVAGTGSADNNFFSIAGNELRFAQLLPAGKSQVEVRLRATDLAGLAVERAFTLPVVAPQLRLNEFLAGNSTGLLDENIEPQDWIELYNELPQTVDLSGWYLTDDRDNLVKWQFPSRTIAPNGYLIVFADRTTTPPATTGNLHANFSLDQGGEWFALVKPDGTTIASAFDPPAQFPNVTYGISQDGTQSGYLVTPTPGAANSAVAAFGENTVTFSQPHGFFSAAFQLTLTPAAPGSTIRYTLNGSKPTASAGIVYSAPLTITPDTNGPTKGTRLVRAIAINPQAAYAPVATNTYLFVNGTGSPATNGIIRQSTLVSSIINHATYGPLMDDALLALPAVSVISPSGPSTSENAASVELFDSQQLEPGFQIDCGLNVTGTTSLGSPKLSMAAKFRSQYGKGSLDYPVFARFPVEPEKAATEFKELRLRSGSHDTFFWLATAENPPVPYGSPPVTRSGDAQLVRNIWIEEMQLRMGQPGKRGRMVQLFFNGSYHGIYHIQEHPDDDYMASYYAGSSEDFHFTGAATTGSNHGGGDSWSTVWGQLKASLSNYTEAKRWIDVTNLADYMVLSFYAGNDWDWWPQRNWSAAGPKLRDRGGWKFFEQDSDICLQDVNANCTDQGVPDGIFGSLRAQHADFRVLFRDRIYKHCFHGGVLTPAKAASCYNARAEEIFVALVAETARWQPGSSVGPLPWDRDGEWTVEWNYFKNTFFPQRTNVLLNQIRANGWYPIEAPEYNQRGGAVPSGFDVTMTAPAGTTIYYTIDGSDPRLPGGVLNPNARSLATTPLVISGPTFVRARARSADWSAINEASFVLTGTVAATAANLCLTEIGYNPAGDTEAEFLEFQNTSADSIDASGVRIAIAVDFVFPPGTVLAPGERVVVVKNAAVFDARFRNTNSPWHHGAIRVAGAWTGSLNNGGESITVLAAEGAALFAFSYDDSGGWPGRPDGKGSALEVADSSAAPVTAAEKSTWLGTPENWRASAEYHGSPGWAGTGPDNRIVINEILSASVPPESDAIELLNTTGGSISIGGWFLSDDSDNYKKFRFPAAAIQAGAYLVLTENDFNNPANPASLVPFSLNSDGDDVFLLEADGAGNLLRFVDHADFGSAPGGLSIGRVPNATGALQLLKSPTLGAANSTGFAAYGTWIGAMFPAGTSSALTGPAADPDGDSLSNLAEYAFVLSPTAFDISPLRYVNDGNCVFQYRVRTSLTEVQIIVGVSNDLVVWDDSGAAVEILSQTPQPDGSTIVTSRLTHPSPLRRFVRVLARL